MFKNRTLAIFCDASMYNNVGFAGAIAVLIDVNNYIYEIIDEDYKVLENATNNRAEEVAMFLAVGLVNKYKFSPEFGPSENIPIFSDSKLTVSSLRTWIFNWCNQYYQNMYNGQGQLYSTSGQPVANQDLLLSIVNYIVYNNLKLNIYHCKGHVNETQPKSIHHAKKVFEQSNGITLRDDIVRIISHFNNVIDKTTGDLIEPYMQSKLGLIYDIGYNMNAPIINRNELNQYKSLVNYSRKG